MLDVCFESKSFKGAENGRNLYSENIFIDNLYIDRITYYDNELNEEVEIIDNMLISYLESIGLNRETSFNSWQNCENINDEVESKWYEYNDTIDFENILDEDGRYHICLMYLGKYITVVLIDNFFA